MARICSSVIERRLILLKSSSISDERINKLISNLIKEPVPAAVRSKASGLRPLACWDCGFESHRGHRCLSVVSDVCFQVEVSATS